MPFLKLSPIPRIARPAASAFKRDFVDPELPVVITRAIDDWPARSWSPEVLKERFGGAKIRAYVLKDGRIQLDARRGFLLEDMLLGDYIDYAGRARLTTGAPGRPAGERDEPAEVRWYLRAHLRQLPAGLRKDVPVPEYCAHGVGLRKNLWYAARGTVSQLHFDLPRNLVAQLYGKKRFILFSPRDSNYLYPYSWFSSTPHLSQIDPEKPSKVFPLLALARGFSCQLEPGDMLFIPPRWWHHARALEVSIAVNFWWSSPKLYPLVLASDVYKLMRGLNI
jgi:hypothetical protein